MRTSSDTGTKNDKQSLVYKTSAGSWLYLIIPLLIGIFLLLTLTSRSFHFIALVLLFMYFMQQWLGKQFYLYEDKLIIKYPFSFLLKDKKYLLDNILYLHFKSSNAMYDRPRVLIKCIGKSPKRLHFEANEDEIQDLIDELRDLNIEVKVTSHVWE